MTEKRNMFHRLLGRAVRSVSIVILIVVVMLSSLVLLPQAKAVQAAGLSYFVNATAGSDSNDGRSEAKAWKTIAKVNAVSFVPGDQILFKRGETWKETLSPISSGTSGSPIVFGSYGSGDRPIIDGENIEYRRTVQVSNKSYLTFQGLDCRNGYHGLIFDTVDHITVQDCVATGATWYGIGFYRSQYNLVENCIVSNTQGGGIVFEWNTTHSRAHNNVVHDCSGAGIEVGNIEANQQSDYNEFDGNDCYANGMGGLYLQRADHNLIHDNHFHHAATGEGEPYGIGVRSSSYNEIYDNELNDNVIDGIEVWSGGPSTEYPNDYACDGNKIYRNKIYNNARHGIAFGAPVNLGAKPVNVEVYNNLIYDNEWCGLHISGDTGSGNKLYNNTIVGNKGAPWAQYSGIFFGEIDGWDVKNNIMADNTRGEFFGSSGCALTHDHNLCHRASGDVVNYNGTAYDAAHITDFEVAALSSDPLFVDEANHDYRLQNASPAINVGINVGLTTDFDGNPISGQPDIGAFENNQVTPTPVNPTLSGRVTKTDGGGMDGVTLTLSNSGGSVITSGGGYYNAIVAYGWSGKVTPSYTNGSFNPNSRDYSNITGNQTSQDFGWTAPVNPTISGRVTQKNGAGLDGVVLTLSNSGGKVTTSGGGYYTMTVTYGWSGKVTPSYSTKGVFTPSSKSYSNVTSNKTGQNYSWNKK